MNPTRRLLRGTTALTAGLAVTFSVPVAEAAPRTHGDMNGDGKADILAYAGISGESAELYLVRGAAFGSIGPGKVSLEQTTPGVPFDPHFSDKFGMTSMVYGDFNKDGLSDVVIGSPGKDVGGKKEAGAIVVLYGAAKAPYFGKAQGFTENSAGMVGVSEAGDSWGHSLQVGDFNGDGNQDLAVGSPGQKVGSRYNAGAVTIIKGTKTGLSTAGSKSITKDSSGIPGVAESYDYFGFKLGAGNVAGSAHQELVVMSPGTATSATPKGYCNLNGQLGSFPYNGTLTVLRGSASGLTGTGSQFFTAKQLGLGSFTKWFHASATKPLVVGKLHGSGYSDIAVAAENVNKGLCEEGVVGVLRGGKSGVSAKPAVLTQATAGRARKPRVYFGEHLAAGEVNGDKATDLMITGRGYNHADGKLGFASFMFGSAKGPGGTKKTIWTHPSANVVGFDTAVLLDLDGDGRAEGLTSFYGEWASPGSNTVYAIKFDKNGNLVRNQRIAGPEIGEYYGPRNPLAF